ncbi:MAG: bifunctional DNA primase/polymerase [Nocardioides sp.]
MSTRQAALLHYAHSYAARGWHVFVLSASKSPLKNCAACAADGHCDTPEAMQDCGCLTCHGFYAATTDPDRLTEMLTLHPRGMLAVHTGAVSGLAVVDVDFKTFDGLMPAVDDPAYVTLSGLDRERLLPGTLTQSTGSAGLHLLYAHPGG